MSVNVDGWALLPAFSLFLALRKKHTVGWDVTQLVESTLTMHRTLESVLTCL